MLKTFTRKLQKSLRTKSTHNLGEARACSFGQQMLRTVCERFDSAHRLRDSQRTDKSDNVPQAAGQNR